MSRTAPGLSVNIIKGVITSDAAAGAINLASYGASGILALPTASYTTFTGGAADNNANVLITTSGNLTTSTTPNAVLIRGDGITVGGAFSMTPNTGELVAVDIGNTGNNLAAANTGFIFGSPMKAS